MEKLRRLPVHSNSPSGTREAGSFGDCKSHIVDNVVLLRDWYLIKSPKAHMGKRLAVGGILSKGDLGVNSFESAPIIQRVNASRLRTADGLTILLFGLIDGRRTSENGFPNEALSFFQIGFPFTWEVLADGYISSDDTSCSSLGHANDVNELMHSAGRAKHVRIFSDAEKGSKSDSASGPENDRSMQSSFARKVEDRCGSFLKDPALQVGSNPKNLSPSDAWKSEDKGSVHKYNISSSGSALGNIQNFDDDGKIHPDDGDRCVKNYLDEAILNQTLSDTLKSISMGQEIYLSLDGRYKWIVEIIQDLAILLLSAGLAEITYRIPLLKLGVRLVVIIDWRRTMTSHGGEAISKNLQIASSD
ncbi:hypothetical protein EJ110_NYTH26160 [Nymphaea thermarum]|nr:hypothetical protein EJ110_NYTH26160 [Nymphaea thermarum]